MNQITFNNTVIQCSNDGHCPSNAVCLFQGQQQIINNTNGYCGCNPEAGLIGNLCSDVGPTGISRIVLLSIFAFITFVLVLFATIDLFRMHMNGSLKRRDVKATTLIECLIGLISLFVLHVSGIALFFQPFDVSLNKISGDRKSPNLTPMRNIFTALASFFITAGVLNVGILWLQVAIASNKFKRISNPQLSRKYIFVVLSVDVIMIIAMGACIFINPSLAGAVTAPFVTFIGIVYFYSAVQISRVMKIKMSENTSNSAQVTDTNLGPRSIIRAGGSDKDKKILEALRRIQVSALWIVSTYLLITILLILSSLLGNKMRRIYLPPNAYYIPSLFSDIAYLILSIAISSVIWYIHHHSSGESKPTNLETVPATTNEARKATLSMNSSNTDGILKVQPPSSLPQSNYL